MPTFNVHSTTGVVIKPYEYEGSDNPKPNKLDLDYVGGTTYGEILLLGTTADASYDVGDIVIYTAGAGVETMIDGELVRVIDLDDIHYYLS